MAYYQNSDEIPYTPMTSEEENELFRQYKKGGSLEARDKLIHQHLRWAASLASQYAPGGMQIEDAISAANMGLLQAIERFDPAHGTRLSTYMRKLVLGAVYAEARQSQVVHAGTASRQPAVLSVGEWATFSNRDVAPGVETHDEPTFADDEHNGLMLAALKKALDRAALTPIERYVVKEHYFMGRCYGHIGKNMPAALGKKVTRQRIEQIHKAALVKLRGLVKQYGVEWIRPTPVGE